MTYQEQLDVPQAFKFSICYDCEKYDADLHECRRFVWWPYYGPGRCQRQDYKMLNEYEIFNALPPLIASIYKHEDMEPIVKPLPTPDNYKSKETMRWIREQIRSLSESKQKYFLIYLKKYLKRRLK